MQGTVSDEVLKTYLKWSSMLDKGTFGGNKIDHIVVDMLNKRNDNHFTARVLAIIGHYNKDLKEVYECNLPRHLKIQLFQKLLDDRKNWLNGLGEDPIKSYLANCFVSKKRFFEKGVDDDECDEEW